MEKFRQGVFGSKKVKTKNEEGEVVGEESLPSPVIPLWKEAVKECTTFSRMHVLLGTVPSQLSHSLISSFFPAYLTNDFSSFLPSLLPSF